jgi:hypothetical protein
MIQFTDNESPSDTPFHLGKSKGTPIYGPLEPWDTVFEDDRAVYIRMLNACFQHLGEWRRWLPFYGVVSVTEVMVSLTETALFDAIPATNQEPLR